MTTGNDKTMDEFKDAPPVAELYNKEAFDKLIKEANAALDLGSEEQVKAELSAVINRHEETIKLSPVLPTPFHSLREELMGGFHHSDMVILASPHRPPLIERLYYSLDRTKQRVPPVLPISFDRTKKSMSIPKVSLIPSMCLRSKTSS